MIDLRLGDCLEVLKTLPDNSVDSIVTDPPYHLTSITKRFGKEGSAPAQYGTDGAFARASKGFMGKEWDGGDIAFRTDVWAECLRVLKPGGHLLSFGGSRTYHRMAVAIEDAGFEVRDQIMWVYGSGFPKSHNIGKAIDKMDGKEVPTGKAFNVAGQGISLNQNKELRSDHPNYVKPSYDNDYEGWGTALKPAHEPICMARKPLSEKSIAENVLKHGTGGINIDASRIELNGDDTSRKPNKPSVHIGAFADRPNMKEIGSMDDKWKEGRFPANIMFDEEAGKLLDEQSGVKQSQKRKPEYNKPTEHTNTYTPKASDYREDNTYDDKGGASRFFYCPKVSKKERGDGNVHPTVKPIALMEYLIKLVTPNGGVVLEPFMGSGSTGIAAKNLGMSFIGIEREQEYFDIAKQRINNN